MVRNLDSANYFSARLQSVPVGIFRGLDPMRTVELCVRAWQLGVELVEVPIQSADAIKSLEAAIAAGKDRGRDVGAGSIHSMAQLTVAAELGAAFTVSPGVGEGILLQQQRK